MHLAKLNLINKDFKVYFNSKIAYIKIISIFTKILTITMIKIDHPALYYNSELGIKLVNKNRWYVTSRMQISLKTSI